MLPCNTLPGDHSRFRRPEPKLPKLTNGDTYRFHVMVKPTGSQCNLACDYCFYLHKEDLLAQPAKPRMSNFLLEEHIRQYIEAQTGPEVIFSWQGGEPTLIGLEFFQHIITLQQRYKKPGQTIENDLQTNGILLSEDWCAFLKEKNFLVGLSIDGPAELHDVYRHSKSGRATFDRVMRAVGLLHKHQVPFSAMCVVNRINARKPLDVYRFLREKVRPRTIQFTPGVEPLDFRTVAPGHWDTGKMPIIGSPNAKPGNTSSVVTDWSIDPDDWGYFLTRIWDEWIRHDYGKVFIDQFENIISQMFGFGAQKCVTAQICGKGLAIEHNGDLYSCDHFVYPEYRLGNIFQEHQGDLVFSEKQKYFAFAKHQTLPQYCRSCIYLKLCWGECPRNRFVKSPEGQPGLNYLCRGMKQFYEKATSARDELSKYGVLSVSLP